MLVAIELAPPSSGEPSPSPSETPTRPSAQAPSGPLSLSAREAGTPRPESADPEVDPAADPATTAPDSQPATAAEDQTRPASPASPASFEGEPPPADERDDTIDGEGPVEEPPSLPPRTPPRQNRSLDRETHPTRFVIGAAGRFSILAGSGSEAVQPYGGGFGVFARFTPWHAGIARFGFAFDGGYARWTERISVAVDDGMGGETTVRRAKVLGHADLSLGPNLELVAGPVIFNVTTGVGMGINTYLRPAGVPEDEVSVASPDFLWRSSLALMIPIYRDQGLAIGTAINKYVTRSRVALPELADPTDPEGTVPEVAIFDLAVETSLAYVAWF